MSRRDANSSLVSTSGRLCFVPRDSNNDGLVAYHLRRSCRLNDGNGVAISLSHVYVSTIVIIGLVSAVTVSSIVCVVITNCAIVVVIIVVLVVDISSIDAEVVGRAGNENFSFFLIVSSENFFSRHFYEVLVDHNTTAGDAAVDVPVSVSAVVRIGGIERIVREKR